MADDEAKNVPSTNEEVAEAEPEEVPDQNVDQNQEETGVSETNATDETAESFNPEEGQSEEPPTIQEPSSPAPNETTEVKDEEAPAEVEATTGDDSVKDAVQDDAKTEEAPEESQADETQEAVTPEDNKGEEEEQSEKPLQDTDDSHTAQEEEKREEDDDHKQKNSKSKSKVSIRWGTDDEDTHHASSQDDKLEAEREEGEGPEDETEKLQDSESIMPELIHRETCEYVDATEEQQEQDLERNEAGDVIESAETAQERSRLIEQYQQCISIRDSLQQQNSQIQQKLAEFFRKKKPEDSRAEKEAKNIAELEQRYLKLMAQIEELQEKQEMEKKTQMQRIDELENQCAEKKDRVNADQQKLTEMKRMVAQHAINSRSGKPIPDKDIDNYLANEAKKDTELEWVRLENIKLKNKLKKKELQLKSKEELAEGLHLIDFEQLKIENQTYNEKIEERNEELQKLRKKIKSTVEVQTHMKEKLQFIEVENEVLYTELQEIEGQVARKRDELSRTKQMRDALKRNNLALHKNCGLLGNHLLLRNFEEQKDSNQDLLQQLEDLKMTYAEYTMQAKHVQKKIDQATQQQMGF